MLARLVGQSPEVFKPNFVQVISFAEADRRGIIYDRKYLSFLFDLNREWCIDAARLGNKTRFINHADSESSGLNCEAKIFLVNGEHRIKFVALREIEAGEELLFNYGKKFAEKHGLSKKLPKVPKEGGKKGVIVGEEALNALDGNRARRKETAIRGNDGGRRAVKSVKLLPKQPDPDTDDNEALEPIQISLMRGRGTALQGAHRAAIRGTHGTRRAVKTVAVKQSR
jgi:histone-lysine N-methyltransferase EZH2